MHVHDAPQPTTEQPAAETAQRDPGAAGLSTAMVLRLQRTAGNAAVNRVLARRERGGTATERRDWTRADRETGSERWHSSNEFNLLNGNSSDYATSEERSAFYRWFYIATTTRPEATRCETRWPLAAHIVASGVWDMVDLPNSEGFAKDIGITSEEIQTMLRRGNQVIFDNVFPKLRDLWNNPRKAQAAIDWDAETLAEEQTLIQPLYDGASSTAINILQNMATGTYSSAQMGARIFPSGTVQPGPNIIGGRVAWFSGNLRNIADRWRYGMLLATNHSTLRPHGTVPTSPPSAGAAYAAGGSALASVDWRNNLHEFEAAADNSITWQEEIDRAVAAMRRFSVREQHHFLGNWEYYLQRARYIGAYHIFRGMTGWSANLPVQIRFLDALGMLWSDVVNYGSGTHDLQTMVQNATDAGRAAIRGSFFQRIFERVCDDSTIVTAVNDLGIPEPERSRWISSERSWL